MSDVEVSVVLPAYNEEDTIADTVAATLDALGAFLPAGSFEVIVAEDGCDDRTPAIAGRLAEEDDRVRHIHAEERLGRGGALEYAFRRAGGEVLVYFDTDLATDLAHLEELVEAVRSGECDLATGSRRLAESDAARPVKRDVPSAGYNALVSLFLRSDVRDHQCGFKSFEREALCDLLADVQDDHWFWDTEVLVRAQRADLRIKEFPVRWEPQGDSKVDLVRDVLGMGSQILRTWWQLSVSPRITPWRSFAAGSVLVLVAVALASLYLPVDEVIDAVVAADYALVGASAVVYALSWPLRGVRYRDILAAMGYGERWEFLTGAVFVSQTGNLVFPARAGDAIRAYVVKARRGIPYPSGFASLAVERVFDLLTITVLSGAVLLALVATGSADVLFGSLAAAAPGDAPVESGRTAVRVAAAVGLFAVAVTVAIVLGARSDREVVRGVVGRLSADAYADRVAGVIERFVGDVQTVATDARAFVRVAIASLVIWTVDIVTALLVLAAFDVALSPAIVAVGFFAVSVGNLAKVLPLTPGGVGLYEGAFTLIVAALTPVGTGGALGAAIVDHAMKNAVTVVGGFGAMAWLNVSLTTAVRGSHEAGEESAEGTDIEPEPVD